MADPEWRLSVPHLCQALPLAAPPPRHLAALRQAVVQQGRRQGSAHRVQGAAATGARPQPPHCTCTQARRGTEAATGKTHHHTSIHHHSPFTCIMRLNTPLLAYDCGVCCLQFLKLGKLLSTPLPPPPDVPPLPTPLIKRFEAYLTKVPTNLLPSLTCMPSPPLIGLMLLCCVCRLRVWRTLPPMCVPWSPSMPPLSTRGDRYTHTHPTLPFSCVESLTHLCVLSVCVVRRVDVVR